MSKRHEAIYEGSAAEKISRAGDKVFKGLDKIIAEAVDEVLKHTKLKEAILEELKQILQLAATRELMSGTSDIVAKQIRNLGAVVFDKEAYIKTLDEKISSRRKELAKLEKRVLTYNVMERMQGRK